MTSVRYPRDDSKNLRSWGRFHKSWAQGANHRDSSIKAKGAAQSAPYAYKKFLKSWAQGANWAQKVYEIDPKWDNYMTARLSQIQLQETETIKVVSTISGAKGGGKGVP